MASPEPDETEMPSHRDVDDLAARYGGQRQQIVEELAAFSDQALVGAIRSQSSRAIALLRTDDWQQLATRVRTPGQPWPVGFAWRAGYALHQLGQYQQASDLFAEALSDLGEAEPAELAQLFAAAASTAWNRGERETCRALVDQALSTAVIAGDASARASAYVAQALLAAADGDRHLNSTAYHRALRYAEDAGDLITQTRVLNNLASAELEEGRYAEAVTLLNRGLELSAVTGSLTAAALLRLNLAEALLGLGRLDEAVLEAEAARAMWAVLESPATGAAWGLLGAIQATRGNLHLGAVAFEASLQASVAAGDGQERLRALAGLARLQIVEDREAGLRLLGELEGVPAALSRIPADLARGWCELYLNPEDAAARRRAAEYADDAAREAYRTRDHAALAEALELTVLAGERDPRDPRLSEANRLWTRMGNEVRRHMHAAVLASLSGRSIALEQARRELNLLGVHNGAWEIPGPLHAARGTESTCGVRIHALGRFTVTVDGEPLMNNVWRSRKARDLLKLLAIAGPSGSSRMALLDDLWPEGDAGNDKLSVALSQLRAALDPARTAESQHFVIADRERVRLDHQHVEVDIEEFREAAADALAMGMAQPATAITALEAAAAAYSGVLLPGDDTTWAQRARSDLDQINHELNRALAISLTKAADPTRALPWLTRQLVEDPYDEPTYRALIQLLATQTRYGEARRIYDTYEMRMREIEAPATSWAQMSRLNSPM